MGLPFASACTGTLSRDQKDACTELNCTNLLPLLLLLSIIESNTDISTNSWNNDACAETDLGDLAADLVPPEEIPALVANNLVQEDTAPEEICPLPFNTTEFLITDETATLCTLLTIQHCQADYETTPQLW